MDLKIKFVFDEKIKDGDYSAKYFNVSKKILKDNNINHKSLLRFKHFNKNVMVAGINECLQLIKFALPENVYKKTKIYYVNDGTITNDDDPILALEGNYADFAFLENIIDGILSRRSSVATNAWNIVNLIGSDNVIFMADRSDDYLLQPFDGYAAYIGGIRKFVTNEHVKFIKNQNDISVVGTIPHALIHQYHGCLYDALIAYQKSIPESKIVGLIDFNNDCINEIKLLNKNGFKNLDYVRIDTSKKMIDKSLQKQFDETNDKNLYGVNHDLILGVRKTLDSLGFSKTKIIISSGINIDTIKEYKNKKTPIDIYGVGKSFLNININFTGDLIKLNDVFFAKLGRDENIDHKLKKMNKIN